MTEAEILRFLEGKSPAPAGARPTLAFDTNAIFGDNPGVDPGIELIDTINRANERRGAAPPIAMVISALVLQEKIRQMAQRYRETFDLAVPLDFLRSKNLIVKGFGSPHAIATAMRLQRLHPRKEDWDALKRRSCLQCLGLPETTPAPGRGHRCGGTIDWLIAGQSEAKGYLLVTADTRSEFHGLCQSAPREVCLSAAKQLLHARS